MAHSRLKPIILIGFIVHGSAPLRATLCNHLADTARMATRLTPVGSTRAKECSKAYHVVVVGALEAMRPEQSKRKCSRDQRKGQPDARLVEAWTRVELEE